MQPVALLVATISALALLATPLAPIECAAQSAEPSKEISLYKEPPSLFFQLIREFFTDINWPRIDQAREEIEKFIHKVDRIWRLFKRKPKQPANSAPVSSSFANQTRNSARKDKLNDDDDDDDFQARILGASSWWSALAGSKSKSGSDATNLKQMLERVACYVGYVRLMNLSNEALAELDASKAISSLFASAQPSKGFFGGIFG